MHTKKEKNRTKCKETGIDKADSKLCLHAKGVPA